MTLEAKKTIKVVHIIIGLNIGGAELMLSRLVESQKNNYLFRHSVISLSEIGSVGDEIRANGINVFSLGMDSLSSVPRSFYRLLCLLKKLNPDIVQTWMYHADIFGGFAAYISGYKRILWGIRCTKMSTPFMSISQCLVNIGALLSYFIPQKIICCAKSAMEYHAQRGYCTRKMIVVNNGYKFINPSEYSESRNILRSELEIQADEIVIGVVGRFDPLKDFGNFIDAAKLLCNKNYKLKFLMVGRGLDSSNDRLTTEIGGELYRHQFILVGEQLDVFPYYACMDIFCLSSIQEGFPNALCEAMSMCLPCVVTNVGDSSLIIGDVGEVVPAKSPTDLAFALAKFVDMDSEGRKDFGLRSYRRILDHFSIDEITKQYAEIYQSAMIDSKKVFIA